MAVLPILTGENTPILRTKTRNVPKVTKEIQKLLKDMEETVIAAPGLGLAAPQIGQSHRLCIAMINQKLTPLVNPEILWKSEETATLEEGCLSLPDMEVAVTRPVEITLKYMDEKGHEQERRLKGIDARVVQHEVDHLEGILITDYLQQPVIHVKEHVDNL